MKKIIPLFTLISLIGSTFIWTAAAQNSVDHEVEEIKNEIYRHSRLPIRKIAIRLKNGTTLKGLPTEVEADTFVLLERKTGSQTLIKYTDISKVNRTGLTGGQKKVLLYGAVGTGVALFIIFKPKPKPCDLRRLFC